MGDGVLKRSASARPTLLVLYLGFPLTLLTLLSLLTLHFPDCTHAQKKKVVDCLQERLRETKTAKFLVLLYLLCLLYSHTHTKKVVDYFNERPSSRDQKTVKFYTLSISLLYSCAKKKRWWIGFPQRAPLKFYTQYLFTLLLLLYLLYLKVVDYLKERLRETKTVKFFDNRYSVYLLYWYKSTNTDTALSIYLL
jgi:hypothetical protein